MLQALEMADRTALRMNPTMNGQSVMMASRAAFKPLSDQESERRHNHEPGTEQGQSSYGDSQDDPYPVQYHGYSLWYQLQSTGVHVLMLSRSLPGASR